MNENEFIDILSDVVDSKLKYSPRGNETVAEFTKSATKSWYPKLKKYSADLVRRAAENYCVTHNEFLTLEDWLEEVLSLTGYSKEEIRKSMSTNWSKMSREMKDVISVYMDSYRWKNLTYKEREFYDKLIIRDIRKKQLIKHVGK